MLKRLLLFISLIVISPSAYAVERSVIYEGYTDQKIDESVFRDNSELRTIRDKLGLPPEIAENSLGENSVVVMIPGEKLQYPSQLVVTKIEKDRNGNYKVYYNPVYPLTVLEKDPDPDMSPFVLLKLEEEGIGNKEVVALNKDLEDVIVVDNSINKDVKYTNVLKSQENSLFIDYFPLDKGNHWTYRIIKPERTSEQTFEIVSYTEGWSVFDNFFGKYKTGFRIDQDGALLVSTKSGIRPFYNEDVKIREKNESYNVEAGEFSEVLIVTMPDKDKFWFKDVYAKGVGLIYHKHGSPSGEVEYSLLEAKVSGRKIP